MDTAIFDLVNDRTEDVAAECVVRPDPEGGGAGATEAVVLPARSRRRVFLPYWPAWFREVRLEVRFPGAPGRGYAVVIVSDVASSGPFVGVLSDGAWVAELGHDERVVRVRLRPEDLPPRATALDPFECIHWIDPSPSALSPDALAALVRWVRLGGHLLIETAEAGRLEGLGLDPLPLPAGTPVQANSLTLAAGGGEVEATFAALRLDAPDMAVLARTEHGPVVLTAPADLGRVTVVGLRLGPRVRDSVELYRKLLGRPTEESEMAEGQMARGTRVRTPNSRRVSSFLLSLCEFRWDGLPDIGTLVLLLLGYVVAVGPLEWWCLRRLRRPTWTWWTYPACVSVFTAILWAASGQASYRPVRTRCVQFLDVTSGGTVARVEIRGVAFHPEPGVAEARIAGREAVLWPEPPDRRRGDPGNAGEATIRVGEEAVVSAAVECGGLLRVAGRASVEGRWIELRIRDREVWFANRSPYDWGEGGLFLGGYRHALPALAAGAEARAYLWDDRSGFPGILPAVRDLGQSGEMSPTGRLGEAEDDPPWRELALAVIPVRGMPRRLEFSGEALREERYDYVRCWTQVER